MDQETLNTLMSMVILPLLLALSGFAVAWLRKKTQEITANINDATVRKYVDLASDAVTKAVQTTFQTYVDALKAQGKFDKEAQLTALQKAKDTDKWLASTIETLVREDKRTAPAATEEKQTQIATTAATAAASVAATVAQTAVAQATAEVKAAKATETATE